ncbi:MAG: hypothetical protein JBO36_05035 [Candidatus Thiodiazotropha taylori]|nr:hypothetical protein [Candidatus Thiodiazotropha taylori]
MCVFPEWINKENFTAAAAIATVVGIFVAILGLRNSINQFRKQLQLTVFTDYTKRYQEIILNFPEEINRDDFDFDKLDTEKRDKTLRYMRAYFDLCSEEYFLHSKGDIDEATWNEWRSGMRFAFSKSAFKKGWEIVNLDTMYYPDFFKFVNTLEK